MLVKAQSLDLFNHNSSLCHWRGLIKSPLWSTQRSLTACAQASFQTSRSFVTPGQSQDLRSFLSCPQTPPPLFFSDLKNIFESPPLLLHLQWEFPTCQCRNKTSGTSLSGIRSDLYPVSVAAFCYKKYHILIGSYNLLCFFYSCISSRVCEFSAENLQMHLSHTSVPVSALALNFCVARLDVPDNGAAVALQLWVIRARSRKVCVCVCELFHAPRSWRWYHGWRSKAPCRH